MPITPMVSSTSRVADSVNSLVSSAAKAPEVCLREAAHPRRSVGVAQFAEGRRPAVYGRVERGRVGRRISGRRWARGRERCSALSRGPGGTAVVGRCSDDRWGTESALSSIRRILSVCMPGESPAGMSTWTSEVPDAKTAAQPPRSRHCQPRRAGDADLPPCVSVSSVGTCVAISPATCCASIANRSLTRDRFAHGDARRFDSRKRPGIGRLPPSQFGADRMLRRGSGRPAAATWSWVEVASLIQHVPADWVDDSRIRPSRRSYSTDPKAMIGGYRNLLRAPRKGATEACSWPQW